MVRKYVQVGIIHFIEPFDFNSNFSTMYCNMIVIIDDQISINNLSFIIKKAN